MRPFVLGERFYGRLSVLKDGFRVVDSQITVRASDESFASLGVSVVWADVEIPSVCLSIRSKP
jgi:hypothetical protein